MSAWGIGFGGFVKGLEKGMAARQALEAHNQRREVIGQEMQLRDQRLQSNEMKLNEARRQNAKTEQLRGISQAGVEAYKRSGSKASIDKWYADHVAPKVEEFYYSNGEPDKAEAYRKFAKQTTDRGMIRKRAELLSHFGDAVRSNDFQPIEKEFREFYNGLPAEVRGGAKFQSLYIARQPEPNGTVSPLSPIGSIQAIFKNADGKLFTRSWKDLNEMQDTLYAVSDPVHEFEALHASRKGQKEFNSKVALENKKQNIKTGAKLIEQRLGIGMKSPQERAAETYRSLLENRADPTEPVSAADIADAMKQQDKAVKLYSAPPATKGEKSQQLNEMKLQQKKDKESSARPLPTGIYGAITGGQPIFGLPLGYGQKQNAMVSLGRSVKGTLRDVFGAPAINDFGRGVHETVDALSSPTPRAGEAPGSPRAITAPRPGTPAQEMPAPATPPVPQAAPQYSSPPEEPGDTGNDVGPAVSGTTDPLAQINAARKAIGLPPRTAPPSGINPAPKAMPALAAINAQRARQGLPPLTPDQAAQLMTAY